MKYDFNETESVGRHLRQEGSDDESLHDLAVIHHLLALKLKKQSKKLSTKFQSDWIEKSTCLAASCRLDGHMCGPGHCRENLGEQHCQLAKLFGKA